MTRIPTDEMAILGNLLPRRKSEKVTDVSDPPTSCTVEIELDPEPSAQWTFAFHRTAHSGFTLVKVEFLGNKMIIREFDAGRLHDLKAIVDAALSAANRTLREMAVKAKESDDRRHQILEEMNRRIG